MKYRAQINLPGLEAGQTVDADEKDADIKALVKGEYLVKDTSDGPADVSWAAPVAAQ
jgi:hypothetical protein